MKRIRMLLAVLLSAALLSGCAGQGSGEIAKLIGMIDGDKTLTLEPHLAVFSGYADIDHTEMKHRFAFSSNAEAFDAAARALKDLLFAAGYREEKGGFVR